MLSLPKRLLKFKIINELLIRKILKDKFPSERNLCRSNYFDFLSIEPQLHLAAFALEKRIFGNFRSLIHNFCRILTARKWSFTLFDVQMRRYHSRELFCDVFPITFRSLITLNVFRNLLLTF